MRIVQRLAFVLTIAGLVAAPGLGQTTEEQTTVVGLNLLGPVVGLYSGSFEQAIGDAEPGSLAYYGGGRWHKFRIRAQESMAPYLFD